MAIATDAPSTSPLPTRCSAGRLLVFSLSLLVIFAAGVVSGIAGYSYWHHSYLLWLHENRSEVPIMVVQKLTSQLNLTPAQVPEVKKLVESNFLDLESLQEEIRPRIDARCARYETEMQQILTPEQYNIWLPHFREVCKIWIR